MIILQFSVDELKALVHDQVKLALSSIKELQNPVEQFDEKDLIRIKDAAAFTNFTVPTLYTMASRREIPFHKRDKAKYIWFSKKELTEWLKEGRRKTRKEIAAEADAYIHAKHG